MADAAADKKVFSYGEAAALLPEVRRVTEQAYEQVAALVSHGAGSGATPQEIDELIGEVVRDWAERLVGMGIEVKGLWLADFDNGSGYYCWKYPEAALEYFHGYEEGFAGRLPLQ